MKYSVICKDLESINSLYEELVNKGIQCSSYVINSTRSCVFDLTDEQKDQLLNDDRVLDINNWPPLRGKTCLQQSINPDRTSTNGSSFHNWALSRTQSISSGTPIESIFNYTYTGSGVDVVIVDTGVTDGHPEWISKSTGLSRLKKIDWTLFEPLTSSTLLYVSVSSNENDEKAFVINGQIKPEINTWDYTRLDEYGTVVGTPKKYNFILDATCSGYPFSIGDIPDIFPYVNGPYLTGSNQDSGTVSFTNNVSILPSTSVLYYYCTAFPGMGNLITTTIYNTQSRFFYTDDNGHGTHTTGTVAGSSQGWAREADIYVMGSIDRVDNSPFRYTDFLNAETESLQAVLNWHKAKLTNPDLSARPTVCSNSWRIPSSVAGFGSFYPEILDMNLTVKDMVEHGIIFVRAAGNENIILARNEDPLYNVLSAGEYVFRPGSPAWPSTDPVQGPIVLVGALSYDFVNKNGAVVNGQQALCRKAYFSTKGSALEVFAPGYYIQSSWRDVAYATHPANPSYGLRKISGTSMACPQVAGVIATMLEAGSATPSEVVQMLRDSSTYNNIYVTNNTQYSLDLDTQVPSNTSYSPNRQLMQYAPKLMILSASNVFPETIQEFGQTYVLQQTAVSLNLEFYGATYNQGISHNINI